MSHITQDFGIEGKGHGCYSQESRVSLAALAPGNGKGGSICEWKSRVGGQTHLGEYELQVKSGENGLRTERGADNGKHEVGKPAMKKTTKKS